MKALRFPSDVQSIAGHVLVIGPGIAVTLTPEAAEETGERLIEHAGHAKHQLPEAPSEH
jgi:uncharacterized protein YlxW (UPF0749 family)